MRPTLFIALLIGLSATSLSAQPARTNWIGSRVRVTLTGVDSAGELPVIAGTLVAVGDTALSVRPSGATAEQSIPVSRVLRFHVHAGRDRWAGARFGALVGLPVGLVFGFASGEDCTSEDWICFDREETTVGGAILGAALGTVIGLAIGRGDSWRAESLPQRVSVAPIAGGVGLRIAFQM